MMRILISAYACEPGKGSEPGVGWNMARHLAEHHEIWVLTRANNRPSIEAELARNPVRGLHFVYHDAPAWARFWKRGQRGVQLYYYLWQLTAIPLVRRLHREVGFDVAHHVTFVKYWTPSALAFLDGVPFLWGPVGGGESAPLAFWPTFGPRGILYEALRSLARRLGEIDPLTRRTARRAALALATTPETAARLRSVGAQQVSVLGESALPEQDLSLLAGLPPVPEGSPRFLSVGRLLHWKGFHLGILALLESGLQDAEYWIVGSGPEKKRLKQLAMKLGVANRVRFLGQIPRPEVLKVMAQCHALVHPSLHDSGGWVCIEAMAAGRPVICLDLGGPSVQVREGVGFKVAVKGVRPAVEALASALRALTEPGIRDRLGLEAQKMVQREYSWAEKARTISRIYTEILRVRDNASSY